jgi:diaminopimelate epimerase
MLIHAYKFEGAGNDFVIIDNREEKYNLTNLQIKQLCDRRFGIGADGLMLLGGHNQYDFSMKYYNADGNIGTMCGNGGRCLVAFAAKMRITSFEFSASDGYHIGEIIEQRENTYTVKLKMNDLSEIIEFQHCGKIVDYTPNGEYRDISNTDIAGRESNEKAYFLNTGSPHYIEFIRNIKQFPVERVGKFWRWHPSYKDGTNVNFVEINKSNGNLDGSLFVRTYERGVEAETFACGTGVTASAIAAFKYQMKDKTDSIKSGRYEIETLGGSLRVEFIYNPEKRKYTDIYLTGPAKFVFETTIEI